MTGLAVCTVVATRGTMARVRDGVVFALCIACLSASAHAFGAPAAIASPPLTLERAVDRMLARDPAVRQAWAEVAARAAQLGVARAAYLPTLTAQGSAGRVTYDTRATSLPDGVLQQRRGSLYGALNLNWVLFDSGQRSAVFSSMSKRLAAAAATRDLALQDAYRRAAVRFYDVQSEQARAQARATQRTLALHSYRAAQARVAAGVAPRLEEVQAQIVYARAALLDRQTQGTLAKRSGELLIAMGDAPQAALALAAPAAPRPDPAFLRSVSDLLDDAQRDYPGLTAARHDLAAAEHNVDKVRAEGRPVVSLVGQTGRSTLDDQSRFAAGAWSASTPATRSATNETVIGVQLTIPLFEGFARAAKVRDALAQVDWRRAQLAEIEQRTRERVWDAFQRLSAYTDMLSQADALQLLASRTVEIAEGRYRDGVGTLIDWLDAQRSLADAAEQTILTRMNWHVARLDLALGLGRADPPSMRDEPGR